MKLGAFRFSCQVRGAPVGGEGRREREWRVREGSTLEEDFPHQEKAPRQTSAVNVVRTTTALPHWRRVRLAALLARAGVGSRPGKASSASSDLVHESPTSCTARSSRQDAHAHPRLEQSYSPVADVQYHSLDQTSLCDLKP